MRILHCCLAGPFTDGMGYQENYLSTINSMDGHDVWVAASPEAYVDGEEKFVGHNSYVSNEGVRIWRMSRRKRFPFFIEKKIRDYKDFGALLDEFLPDVILFHGTTAYSILQVAKYRQKHANCKFYVDSHEAYYNSAQSFISKNILHRLFYKRWFQKALPFIDKVFFVGYGEREYLMDMMQLHDEQMEFYPLGGIIIDAAEKKLRKALVYERHDLEPDLILFVHSGKLNMLKKTDSLLRAFTKVPNPQFRLFIIGAIENDYENILKPLVSADKRVQYLGWKTHDELLDYLCAADMYLQPGSVSATLQNAICCGTPVMIYPHNAYEMYVGKNGVRVVNDVDIVEVFKQISRSSEILKDMSEYSYKMASQYLDYRKLAARLYK